MKAMPCIVCRAALENLFEPAPEEFCWENQPVKGTAFQTHGHYGSTVFDPMDGTFLEINVCDECMKKASHDGLIMTGGTPRKAERELRPWKVQQ